MADEFAADLMDDASRQESSPFRMAHLFGHVTVLNPRRIQMRRKFKFGAENLESRRLMAADACMALDAMPTGVDDAAQTYIAGDADPGGEVRGNQASDRNAGRGRGHCGNVFHSRRRS